jgi:hypothetical protein
MDEKDLNETMSIEQRRKRAQIMRAHHTKIERARELAARKLAGEKNIRKRAFQLARSIMRKKVAGQRGAEYAQLGPSEKVAIDRLLDKKVKAIKKLAERLLPKVKKAEYERLQSYLHGKQINNMGAEEGHQMKEELNDLFSEAFASSFPQDPNRPNLSGSPNSTMNSGIGKPKIASAGPKKSKNDSVEFYKPFGTNKSNKITESLSRKAEESGVDFDILAEVFTRGLDSYPETTKVTREQYAFARVNSYINQGKTYFNEDADLHEGAMVDSRYKVSYNDKETDERKHFNTRASNPKEARRNIESHYSFDSDRYKHINTSLNEDADLHELSSATLDSYAKKSNKQAVGLVRKIGDINSKKYKNRSNYQPLNKLSDEDEAEKSSALSQLKKRKQGQALAVKKLDRMGEDVELEEGMAKRKRLKAKDLLNKAWAAHASSIDSPKKAVNEDTDLEEQKRIKACWKGYQAVGFKMKNGKRVPNCVPEAYDINESHDELRDHTMKIAKALGVKSKPQVVNNVHTNKPVKSMLQIDVGKDMNHQKIFDKLKSMGHSKGSGYDRNANTWNQSSNADSMITKTDPVFAKTPSGKTIGVHLRSEHGSGTKLVVNHYGLMNEDAAEDEKQAHRNSKARKKIEKVDRAAPHTELGKQGEILTKIIEAKKLGNKVNDPAKRLQGTDSLDRAYRADTPGEGINESFNIAFAAGVGVTLTAKDLGIQAQSGFAHHPSVVEEMKEIEEDMYAADRKPVYIPAHKSESGATIPAKTVLKRTRKKIVGSGGTHDGN